MVKTVLQDTDILVQLAIQVKLGTLALLVLLVLLALLVREDILGLLEKQSPEIVVREVQQVLQGLLVMISPALRALPVLMVQLDTLGIWVTPVSQEKLVR